MAWFRLVLNNPISSNKESIICATHDLSNQISTFFVLDLKLYRLSIVYDAFYGITEEIWIGFFDLIHNIFEDFRRISFFTKGRLSALLVVDLVEEAEEREEMSLNVLSVVRIDPHILAQIS